MTLREKLEDGITVAFRQYASYEDARQAGIINIAADAAILALRQWLADQGLVIVPAEPTPRMFAANSNCTTPELWAGIGWAAMISAAPDVLGKP